MDDGFTALRNTPGPGASAGLPRALHRARAQPHPRRRRAFALGSVAVLALIAGAVTGAGGGTATHPLALHLTGYFGRLQTLAGTGPGSFVVAERNVEISAINRPLTYAPYGRIAGTQ